MTAHQPEVKPKSEKDKLKEKYPALCKPDAAVWTVRLIKSLDLNQKWFGKVHFRDTSSV